MPYIFLDESGDLGFDFSKKGVSNFFIITFLFCENKKPVEKCVKSVYVFLKHNHKKIGSVLHAHKEKPATRIKLLKKISKTDCLIMAVYLNKKRVYTRLQDEKTVLYNYVANILLDRIFSKRLIPAKKELVFIASRKETNKFLNENFKNYISDKTRSEHGIKIIVEIKTPAEEKCLQAADFISWAFFRKHEHGDDSYIKIVGDLIVEENALFA